MSVDHGDRMRQRAEAVKAGANWKVRDAAERLVLTAEHVAERSHPIDLPYSP